MESASSSGGPADMAATLAAYYAGDFGPFVAFAYLVSKSEYDEHRCRERTAKQQALLRDAMALIPTVIIQPEEQYALYARLHFESRQQYAATAAAFGAAHAAALDRWQGLFAANAQRIAAAGAVLTAAKVEALRRRDVSDPLVSRLFDGTGRAEMLAALNRLQSYVTSGQARAVLACNDVTGFMAVEDQRDALAYAAASYSLAARQAAFAPLKPDAEARLHWAEAAKSELQDISARLRDRPCAAEQPHLLKHLAPRVSRVGEQNNLARTTPNFAATEAQRKSALRAVADLGFCFLWKTGDGLYRCGGGQGGSPYANRFSQDGDPRTAVLGRSHDGGYRSDNRDPDVRVAHAVDNIRDRIAALQAARTGPAAAVPVWQAANATALSQAAVAEGAAAEQDRAERERFDDAHAAETQAARAYVSAFLAQPATRADPRRLLRDVDAAELALPQLAASEVPPDAPALPGVTASERSYGEGSASLKAIVRERLRAETDLASAPKLKALSDRLLNQANRFASEPGGRRIVEELITDSAAVRQLARGGSSTLQISAVDNQGRWRRAEVTDVDHLLADSVLARTEAFSERLSVYRAQSAGLRSTIGAGDEDASYRRAASDGADRLAADAERRFYGGDLVSGADLLAVANATLDLGLSLTPGIGWARDVYEALYGIDLVSREPLDTFSRTAAVLGVLTAGVGDDALRAARIFSRIDLGESLGRTVRILDASRGMRSDNLQWADHVWRRISERGTKPEQINNLMRDGSRFWDTQERTIVIVEHLQPGRKRMAIAINPDDYRVVTVMWNSDSDAKWLRTGWQKFGRPRYRAIPGGGGPLP